VGRDNPPLGGRGRTRKALSQRGFDAADLSKSRTSQAAALFSIPSKKRPCPPHRIGGRMSVQIGEVLKRTWFRHIFFGLILAFSLANGTETAQPPWNLDLIAPL
jgi:hypothetical protein